MEKEFLPYKQALALKELGFDKPCVAHFTKDFPTDKPYILVCEDKSKNQDVNKMSGYGVCLAPLYQQCFRFFREEYKLSCSIELTDNSRHYYFNFTIYDSKNRDYNDEDCFDSCKRLYDNRKYSTYEEAELECLKKLIEIVKNR